MIITAERGKENKMHISVDGEYLLTVDADFWYACPLSSGDEINQETLEEFKNIAFSRRAFHKALDYLSRRDHCRRELEKKLSRFFDSDAVNAAIEKLENLGLLNDEAYAQKLSEELLRLKSYSVSRIRCELIFRGISREIAEETVSEIEVDERECIAELLNTKFRRKLTDEKGIKSVIAALTRLGYDYSDIRSAISELNLDELD